ncbi:hypothetical protein AA101099_1306 [Neoasaia chiangmaiensis NBRC 101099]|uniref:hypothetical protein n=1 Tax=Neoasaia chiangmaiensis TaxID=320497 RepID=UPI00118FBE68|nr:hypothetical protein [Neoasaia chiangmaiensis]GBR38706.1 hypothetical protein AA101099_1306 [Neoasaia chiangmaiensis NBRC 101099]GEN15777.1 hypothetical protein NCH01_22080 [Neoasaia chiangmaiensis]
MIPGSSQDLSSRPVFINDELIPFGAYQAIFHKITKKVDRINRIFNGGYTLKPSDIVNLHAMMHQTIVQYKIVGSHEEVVHVQRRHGSRTFNSIQLFKIADMSSREQTSTISYEMEFLIILPAEIETVKDFAQRYKVSIVIDKDEVDERDDSVPFFLRGFIGTPAIKMSLEYSDYMVAQALSATINGWVNSLPKQIESGYVKFFRKIEGKFRSFSPVILKASPFIGASINVIHHKYGPSTLTSIVLFCFAISIISDAIIEMLIDLIYKNVSLLGPRMLIDFTLGDQDRINSIGLKKKRFISTASFLVVTVIVALIVNIFSSWVYPKIFGSL